MCGRDISRVGRGGHNHFVGCPIPTEDGSAQSCTLWETNASYRQLLQQEESSRLRNAGCSDQEVAALRASCEAAKLGSAAEVED